MPPFLPQELLDMIIDQLGRDILESPPGSRRRAHVHHLANYTLVCRDWMRRVSPYLFEHTYAKSERQLTTLLKSAKLSNRLSMNVNGLSLPTLPHPLDALRILDDIFLTFPHLRELAFSHCEWSYSQPVPALTFAQRHAIGVIRLGTWKHQTSFSFPGYLFAFKCIEILALTQLRAPVSLGRMDDSGQKLHVDSLCLESVVPGHIRSLAEMIEPSTLKRVSLLACSNHAELDALDSLLRSCGQRLQDLVIMLWNVAYLAEEPNMSALASCSHLQAVHLTVRSMNDFRIICDRVIPYVPSSVRSVRLDILLGRWFKESPAQQLSAFRWQHFFLPLKRCMDLERLEIRIPDELVPSHTMSILVEVPMQHQSKAMVAGVD